MFKTIESVIELELDARRNSNKLIRDYRNYLKSGVNSG